MLSSKLSNEAVPVPKGNKISFFDNSLLKEYSRLIPLSILVIVTVLLYQDVFSFEFQQLWDDGWVVKNAYTENGFEFENLWKILTEFYHGQYSPVNEFYYLCIYWVFGYDSFWFHVIGLCVHIANVILFYNFLFRMLKRYSSFSPEIILRISFTTMLIFVVHPILIESVAWLSASKIIIYVLLYLISLHCYLSFLENRGWRYFALTCVFFLLAFGAKEQAVTLPCCLLLMDYMEGRNFRSWAVWGEKIPLLLLSLFFGYLTMLSQAKFGQGALVKEDTYHFYENILLAFFSLSEYVTKCILPLHLSYIYPFPYNPGEPVPLKLWFYPIFITVSLASIWNILKTDKWLKFCALFFVIHIVVTLNLISTARYSIIADRYVYLSSFALFFLIAYCLEFLYRNRPKLTNLYTILVLFYVLALGTYSLNRVKVWHNSDSLKKEIREILKNRPDYDPEKHGLGS